jgi:2-polyprenyl-3-methyl-5-hydroxy-6-metoxy-1,4-benzoquinol methylase
MQRIVEHELLDELPPASVEAVGSRVDLRRLNSILGHADILSRLLCQQFSQNVSGTKTFRLADLGGGDGTFLLRLAKRCPSRGPRIEATLVDQQNIVSPETRRAFTALNWQVESATANVFEWLEQTGPDMDVIIANLFLHHFDDDSLSALLRLVAVRTKLFIACEPRRSPIALAASKVVRFLGCNPITRHDAVLSVRAGFCGHEISSLWPADGKWQLSEHPAGLFSHCFMAKMNG